MDVLTSTRTPMRTVEGPATKYAIMQHGFLLLTRGAIYKTINHRCPPKISDDRGHKAQNDYLGITCSYTFESISQVSDRSQGYSNTLNFDGCRKGLCITIS